jgi:hypothetical protein
LLIRVMLGLGVGDWHLFVDPTLSEARQAACPAQHSESAHGRIPAAAG